MTRLECFERNPMVASQEYTVCCVCVFRGRKKSYLFNLCFDVDIVALPVARDQKSGPFHQLANSLQSTNNPPPNAVDMFATMRRKFGLPGCYSVSTHIFTYGYVTNRTKESNIHWGIRRSSISGPNDKLVCRLPSSESLKGIQKFTMFGKTC